MSSINQYIIVAAFCLKSPPPSNPCPLPPCPSPTSEAPFPSAHTYDTHVDVLMEIFLTSLLCDFEKVFFLTGVLPAPASCSCTRFLSYLRRRLSSFFSSSSRRSRTCFSSQSWSRGSAVTRCSGGGQGDEVSKGRIRGPTGWRDEQRYAWDKNVASGDTSDITVKYKRNEIIRISKESGVLMSEAYIS